MVEVGLHVDDELVVGKLDLLVDQSFFLVICVLRGDLWVLQHGYTTASPEQTLLRKTDGRAGVASHSILRFAPSMASRISLRCSIVGRLEAVTESVHLSGRSQRSGCLERLGGIIVVP